MDNRLYVGNLSDDVSTEALRKRFADYGVVSDVHLAMDRTSGRPRGHAFVTMETAAEARTAMTSLNGTMFDERPLRVNVAGEERERTKTKADPKLPRITSQFRERLNMTYELDWEGVRLAIKMFPTDPSEKEWRIEACTKGVPGTDEVIISASAVKRADALDEVGRLWLEKTEASGLVYVDWAAIKIAMLAVRAI